MKKSRCSEITTLCQALLPLCSTKLVWAMLPIVYKGRLWAFTNHWGVCFPLPRKEQLEWEGLEGIMVPPECKRCDSEDVYMFSGASDPDYKRILSMAKLGGEWSFVSGAVKTPRETGGNVECIVNRVMVRTVPDDGRIPVGGFNAKEFGEIGKAVKAAFGTDGLFLVPPGGEHRLHMGWSLCIDARDYAGTCFDHYEKPSPTGLRWIGTFMPMHYSIEMFCGDEWENGLPVKTFEELIEEPFLSEDEIPEEDKVDDGLGAMKESAEETNNAN